MDLDWDWEWEWDLLMGKISFLGRRNTAFGRIGIFLHFYF
jgi:hypothetical protein